MSDNSPALLKHPKHGEMVGEFGAWIVTKTYSTTRRAAAVLQSKESAVDVTLSLSAQGAGNLTPTAGWWNHTSDSTWSIHNEVRVYASHFTGVANGP